MERMLLNKGLLLTYLRNEQPNHEKTFFATRSEPCR